MPTTLDDPRLIVTAVLLVIAALLALGRLGDRRRQARLDSLATAMGGKLVSEPGYHWHVTATVADRTFTVRHRYLSKGGGWVVFTELPLDGVSQLHAVDVRRRLGRHPVDPRDADFARHFAVHDLGMPLRDGWMTPRVRGALAHFFAHELATGTLSIEEGRLVHRGFAPLRRYTPLALRELLGRHAALAAALERSL